jgi:hypothetical protein
MLCALLLLIIIATSCQGLPVDQALDEVSLVEQSEAIFEGLFKHIIRKRIVYSLSIELH